MVCKTCGKEVTADMETCPNCGEDLTELKKEEAAKSEFAEIAQEMKEMEQKHPELATQPVNETPKKKNTKWLIVLIAILAALAVIVAIVLVFVLNTKSAKKNGADAYEAFLGDYANTDTSTAATDMTEDLPTAFWDYIQDTYSTDEYTVDQTVATKALQYYLTDKQSNLMNDAVMGYDESGNVAQQSPATEVTYEIADSTKPVVRNFNIGGNAVKSELKKYGVSGASTAVGFTNDITWTGDESEEWADQTVWMVKNGKNWYSTKAMDMIDEACQNADYLMAARAPELFDSIVSSYWTSYTSMDSETLATLVPDQFWDYMEDANEMDKDTAINCMSNYLESSIDSMGDEISVTYEITDATVGDEDTLASYNEGLEDYNLTFDSLMILNVTVTPTIDGTAQDASETQMVLVKKDDQWYAYDVMYYFSYACYYYTDEAMEYYAEQSEATTDDSTSDTETDDSETEAETEAADDAE